MKQFHFHFRFFEAIISCQFGKKSRRKKCVVLTCKKRCYHELDTDQKITNGNFRSQAAEFLYDSKRSHMSPDNRENTKKKYYHAMRRMILPRCCEQHLAIIDLVFHTKLAKLKTKSLKHFKL